MDKRNSTQFPAWFPFLSTGCIITLLLLLGFPVLCLWYPSYQIINNNIMKSLSIAGLLLFLAACGPNTSRSDEQSAAKDSANAGSVDVVMQKDVVVRPLSGYFVNNTVKFSDSVQCWVINNAEEMRKIFGMAKTMNNTIDTIDFSQHLLAAVVLQPSDLTQSIELTRSYELDGNMDLHFAIRVDTPKTTYTKAMAWLGAIPKSDAAKHIRFFKGDRMMTSINAADLHGAQDLGKQP